MTAELPSIFGEFGDFSQFYAHYRESARISAQQVTHLQSVYRDTLVGEILNTAGQDSLEVQNLHDALEARLHTTGAVDVADGVLIKLSEENAIEVEDPVWEGRAEEMRALVRTIAPELSDEEVSEVRVVFSPNVSQGQIVFRQLKDEWLKVETGTDETNVFSYGYVRNDQFTLFQSSSEEGYQKTNDLLFVDVWDKYLDSAVMGLETDPYPNSYFSSERQFRDADNAYGDRERFLYVPLPDDFRQPTARRTIHSQEL